MYYLNTFFIFSILGHFIENFFYHSKDSGILYGYWTPIYGIGVIVIILINKILTKKKLNTFIHIISLFIISALTLSIMELTGGYMIELVFNKVFWNYSNMPLNIGKYTSVTMGLIWGISSIIFIYTIKPITEIIIKKIPRYITYILSTFFLIDFLFTILKVFS